MKKSIYLVGIPLMPTVKRIFLIAFVFSVCLCAAQEPIEKHLLKVNIFTPGFSYEYGITDRLSLSIDAQISFYFHFAFGTNDMYHYDESYVLGFPSGLVMLPYYFNRAARERRGRSLYKNSGLFIAPALYVQGPDIINTNKEFVTLSSAIGGGFMWGVQRTFLDNCNVSLGLGLGYAKANGAEALDGFVFLNKLTIGIVLFPNAKKEKIKPPKAKEESDY